MIIHPVYGPQFDRTDGTIGELRLVKRWFLLYPPDVFEGRFFTPRQGRYAIDSREAAEQQIRLYQEANPNRPEMRLDALQAVEFWCYPNHFDPCGRVEE